MKDLKFRAWDELNKIMHNDFQFIRSGTEGNDWILFVSDKQPLGGFNWKENPYFAQQIKIMQFTGLSDKNGKEIYEGDIVKKIEEDFSGTDNWDIKDPRWELDFPLIETVRDVVTFDRFRYWLKNEGFGYEGENLENPERFEVIGNIYENPELL